MAAFSVVVVTQSGKPQPGVTQPAAAQGPP
jgi:hypothetical protein